MKVQVTIKDGKIADIQIVSHSETGSYLERAKTLLQKMIDNNGTTGSKRRLRRDKIVKRYI